MDDTRNLVDGYKGMANEAIVADLDKSRIPLQIAIENLAHDFNIGTIIRNANAFNVEAVHIIGRRKYNRRGAMVTDRYLHIHHHANVAEFAKAQEGRTLVAVENNVLGARPLSEAKFVHNTTLIFGSESDGISEELLGSANAIYYIEQLGSTRSINVGCASAVAMYEYCRRLQLFREDSNV